ncbi:Pyruvate decarboxylase 3 [Vitis vinifera]|uniref:Pyruvate decarboxylase 3 n=1 Tax=Vitis vinifera TaxID=29760 RepID=A0A438J767_VITVI|nr:Pyruvate decarboxylase 3 [Vitis vinifera]
MASFNWLLHNQLLLFEELSRGDTCGRMLGIFAGRYLGSRAAAVREKVIGLERISWSLGCYGEGFWCQGWEQIGLVVELHRRGVSQSKVQVIGLVLVAVGMGEGTGSLDGQVPIGKSLPGPSSDRASCYFFKSFSKRLECNITAYEFYHRVYVPEGQFPKSDPEEPLRVYVLFQHIQKMLSNETAVIAETGDFWFNWQKLKLPRGCRYEF